MGRHGERDRAVDGGEGRQVPARGVRAFTETAARLMRDSGYTFGCPVSPLILDAPAGLDALERLCRQTLESWVSQLGAAFAAAGMPMPRAETLALLVVSSIEGALLIARARRDVAPVLTIAAELEALVTAALPRKRARRKAPSRVSA